MTKHLYDWTLVWPDTCVTRHLYDQTLLWPDTCMTGHLYDWTLEWPNTCMTRHLYDQIFVWHESPYSKDTKTGVCCFCNLKIVQVMHETGAVLNPFSQASKALLACGILKKDPTVWLTQVSQHLYHPSLGALYLCTMQHTHPSESCKLNIFKHCLVNFKLQKWHNPIRNPCSKGTQFTHMLGCKSVNLIK